MGYAADEVERLILAGHSPTRIAELRGVSQDVTYRTIRELIGSGRFRRSDVLYSVEKEKREAFIEAVLHFGSQGQSFNEWTIGRRLKDKGIVLGWLDVKVLWDFWSAKVVLGDMYEDIRDIELTLHDFIRKALEEHYGEDEKEWWAKGIPMKVRKDCHLRREEDVDRQEPWGYTELIDLKDIIDKKWSILSQSFSADFRSDKPALLHYLTTLNGIRNKVMHPVRGPVPTEDEFQFVRDLKRLLKKTIIETKS